MFCVQVVLAGSESNVLLDGLSAQTLYHVSIFPVYKDNVGLALRGTVTTCETNPAAKYSLLKDFYFSIFGQTFCVVNKSIK